LDQWRSRRDIGEGGGGVICLNTRDEKIY
jgi:hypothetical protein